MLIDSLCDLRENRARSLAWEQQAAALHTLLSLYLRSVTLPFEIRAIAPSYFNDYAVRSFSRGSFHLYISLPPYYTERVLKASSI